MPAMAIVGVLNATGGGSVDDHGKKIIAVEEEAVEDYCLKGVRHLSDAGITKLPAPYILPPSDRPSPPSSSAAIFPSSGDAPSLHLPVIDLSHLRGAGGPSALAAALEKLDAACRDHGFFHLTNHGVSASGAAMLDVAQRFFFDLPFAERAKLMSADVRAPVRYGTSFNQARDAVLCWRDFLKLNCGAQSAWPDAPGDLREVAGRYAADCRRVSAELVAAAMEALGINGDEVMKEEEAGSQMLTVNCYPACPEPEKTLGMPPHSDYGLLTLVLQDDVEGLQVMRQSDGEWLTVDPVPGSFVVNVGDHFEIYSNGRYKSVLHRVRVNSARPRISVASFHSVAADRAVGPAPELLAGGEPPRYMDTDFATFLAYIASAEGKHKTFLESRRLDA